MLTYLEVHLYYTLPPLCLLWLIARPILTRNDRTKLVFHAVIAVAWTSWWDDYIIRYRAWTYHPKAVLFTIGHVPVEEYAFFVIQSLFTGLVFILLSKQKSPALSLGKGPSNRLARSLLHFGPTLGLFGLAVLGWKIGKHGSHYFYLGCILWWACPVLGFLWSLSWDYVAERAFSENLYKLPHGELVQTVLLSTVYLSIVDTIALRAGTWHITDATRTGWWVVTRDLPFEEVLFFMVTNLLLTLGISAFEKAYMLLHIRKAEIKDSSPFSLNEDALIPHFSLGHAKWLLASLLPTVSNPSIADSLRLYSENFEKTARVLSRGSHAFNLASLVFPANVAHDLTILYAFCRTTDDIIDQKTKSALETEKPLNGGPSGDSKINEMRSFLGKVYDTEPLDLGTSLNADESAVFVLFAELVHSTGPEILPKSIFEQLIAGYELDVKLAKGSIRTEAELIQYCQYVASSVAEMCTIVIARDGPQPSATRSRALRQVHDRSWTIARAREMGVALQLINIARDIVADAADLHRVYIPDDWFSGDWSQEELNGCWQLAHSDAQLFSPLQSRSIPHSHSSHLDRSIWTASPAHRKALLSSVPTDRHTVPVSLYALRLLRLASEHYNAGLSGISQLSLECQPGVRSAIEAYTQIGRCLLREIQHRIVAPLPRDVKPDDEVSWRTSYPRRVKARTWDRLVLIAQCIY